MTPTAYVAASGEPYGGPERVVDLVVASRKQPVLNEAGKTTASAGHADLRDGLRRAPARSEAAFARRLGVVAARGQRDEVLVSPMRADAHNGDIVAVVDSAR